MRGVVFTGGCDLEMHTFEDPAPGPGEVVLEMRASGMCGSDLKFYRAPKGYDMLAALGVNASGSGVIAGHEPSGVVAAVGKDVSALVASVGDRMMVHHYMGCMACSHCRTGWTQMCDTMPITAYGYTAHGGHAPYLKVPAATLVKLPDEVSFSAGAALACGSGTAYNALVRLDLSARDTIAIFGQGPVGLSATQFAAAMGAEVIAIDIDSARVARSLELGAANAIDASRAEPVEAIMALTGGKGVTKALDASGAASGRQGAIKATGTWGTVAFVGEGGELSLDVSRDMIRRQLTVFGSHTFSSVGLADCARFVAAKSVNVDQIFTDWYALDQAREAYARFDNGASGKGVFLF